jgi:hypothetical protein
MTTKFTVSIQELMGLFLIRLRDQRDRMDDEALKFYRDKYSHASFVRELCIYRFGGPRRYGNTTAAVLAAKKLDAELLVAPFPEQVDHLVSHEPGCPVQSYGRLDSYGSFQTVVVDGASYLESQHPDMLDKLIRLLARDGFPTLLLIG